MGSITKPITSDRSGSKGYILSETMVTLALQNSFEVLATRLQSLVIG